MTIINKLLVATSRPFISLYEVLARMTEVGDNDFETVATLLSRLLSNCSEQERPELIIPDGLDGGQLGMRVGPIPQGWEPDYRTILQVLKRIEYDGILGTCERLSQRHQIDNYGFKPEEIVQFLAKFDIHLGGPSAALPNALKREKLASFERHRRKLVQEGILESDVDKVGHKDPDYLDPANPRYAPKLAAAVRAWEAVTDPGKKSPKSALEKWLRMHASEFGLVDDDGNPTNQAIEECSKVANWNLAGGAPKSQR